MTSTFKLVGAVLLLAMGFMEPATAGSDALRYTYHFFRPGKQLPGSVRSVEALR